MPRVKVKICGITNNEDADTAIRLGADALGFIFAESPRRISVRVARKIVNGLPPFVTTVGVFRDQELDEVRRVMKEVRLDFAQLHGSESRDYFAKLKGRAIKVFHLKGGDVMQEIRRFGARTFMLDTPKGWAGTVMDQVEVARATSTEGRLILAGGLMPENVKEAILAIRPFAVDIASGVEVYAGKKSKRKLVEFFRRVREAEDDLSAAQ